MTSSVTNPVKAFAPIAFGLALAAIGIYVVNAAAAPGAAVLAFLLMLPAVLLGLRPARNRLPIWASFSTCHACTGPGIPFSATTPSSAQSNRRPIC